MSGLHVEDPGLLALLQDGGRRGHYRLGLTDGGPLDRQAFDLCNRLLENPAGAAAVELTFGGARFTVGIDSYLCVTGAPMPLRINGEERSTWEVHPVREGDSIALGHPPAGCRAYLGVAGGFQAEPVFGSVSTVLREGLGGLGTGKLAPGDLLPCTPAPGRRRLYLPEAAQPRYNSQVTLRVIPGYQQHHFPRLAQRRFFGSRYTVTDRADRMGYRLEGPVVRADIEGLLSEGICLGAIQLPADGQPIVLLNDRQTIGGYPKIGAALSLDLARLAQQRPGGEVVFTPITQHAAHNALHLARAFEASRSIQERGP
ncbi:5-oxoprolinase subunit C family protein [Pseudohaliea rubra]|uniref:Allophanate hydrolase 2 subunit 2 n=1 Tax=Pseudohaliea rubra DSM 19751 TaxID=1265313 RepID=A0A095XYR2_9GAMM|nr:biotin-dependent carboxyltransferase family protein [Pseudohaliea rubra]KGE04906.1 Allophanate hydrolase 2 subunit 2 [Pseudohaliea rubra DSM 19751]